MKVGEMAKVSRRLNILACVSLRGWPELQRLEEQGHMVVYSMENVDLILGPRCWLMTEKHRKYLNLAVKSARLHKYGSTKKGEDESEE